MAKNEKLVSLIIINWNGEKHLPRLLESIEKQSYENIETIVWDNASTDKSVEIAKKFSDVKVFTGENFGYSGGTSKALEKAKGDYFFVLNNDLVLDKNCVAECVKTIEVNEKAGMVFPKELHYARFPENYEIGFLPKTTFQGNTVKKKISGKETNFVLGAAFLVSKKALNDLKYCFDERFFMYFEDTDLSFRAIAKGYKILYEENAVFWHKTAASVPKTRLYFLFRNCLLCYYKNFGFWGFLKFLPIILLKDLATVCFDLKFKNNSLFDFFRAYFDALKMFKEFKNGQLNSEEKKRIIKSMKSNVSDESTGLKKNFKKIYSAIVSIYLRIFFLIL